MCFVTCMLLCYRASYVFCDLYVALLQGYLCVLSSVWCYVTGLAMYFVNCMLLCYRAGYVFCDLYVAMLQGYLCVL